MMRDFEARFECNCILKKEISVIHGEMVDNVRA